MLGMIGVWVEEKIEKLCKSHIFRCNFKDFELFRNQFKKRLNYIPLAVHPASTLQQLLTSSYNFQSCFSGHVGSKVSNN